MLHLGLFTLEHFRCSAGSESSDTRKKNSASGLGQRFVAETSSMLLGLHKPQSLHLALITRSSCRSLTKSTYSIDGMRLIVPRCWSLSWGRWIQSTLTP